MKRLRTAESNPGRLGKSLRTGFHVPWTALLLAIIAYCHWKLVSSIPLLAVQFDAVKVYLPGAQHLLENGLEFFFTREAYRTAPLNFIWPALFDVDTDAILLANKLLGVSTLLLLFFTAKRLGGMVAAVAAAALYAFSPLLVPLIPTILSEPLFLAGTALWLLGIAHHDSPGKAWLITAVLGGIVSLLARPVWLPFIALSLPFLLSAALAQPKERAWKKLALAHALILLPVALYCLHNLVQFGFFGISTGSGAALYLGNHPLTFGMEPRHLLFDYDVQSMTIPWEGDYLSVAGDRALRTIGWSMIFDRSFAEQLDWMLYKVGAVMFFTKSDFAVDLYSIRALRVFEWIFALYGLTFVKARALRFWFAGALLLQVAQLAMILYNLRYSSGSLELWLILLTGCGLAKLFFGVRAKLSSVPYGLRMALDFDKYSGRILPRVALVLIVLLGCGVAHWHRRLTDPLQPNIDHAP
ncbi:MAG: glycosyltransferase family 39 protein, partial [Betaproteobacteria bacterium]